MFDLWSRTIPSAAPTVNATTGHEAPNRMAKSGSVTALTIEATDA